MLAGRINIQALWRCPAAVSAAWHGRHVAAPSTSCRPRCSCCGSSQAHIRAVSSSALQPSSVAQTPTMSSSSARTHRDVIMSGIQPSGIIHLGNYLGAVMNWVHLQNTTSASSAAPTAGSSLTDTRQQLVFSVVDLHALTVLPSPSQLRHATRLTVATLIASGIDPNKCVLFLQSQVSGHAELTWLLSCVMPHVWLNKMVQFKEKSSQLAAGKHKQTPSLGLFSYPALMTADMLLYRANRVPVGQDQTQHLELARDVAIAFNRHYGVQLFAPPLPMPGPVVRVASLKSAAEKMSKSSPVDGSRINLTDTSEMIAQKISRATTDSTLGISYDPSSRPELANLISIYSAVSGQSIEDVAREHSQSSHSAFKQALSQELQRAIAPIGQRIHELMKDPTTIDDVLFKGRVTANEIAERTLQDVRSVMGLL